MRTSVSSWWLLTLVACAHAGDVFKILVVFPVPSSSHTILGDGVVRHLAAAGHEITYITPSPKKNVPPNVRQVDVSYNYNLLPREIVSIKSLMNKEESINAAMMLNVMILFHNATFHNPNVHEILKNPNEHFDLVVVEWMFSELYCSFSAIFNVPFVWVASTDPHWMVTQVVDEPLSPAYTPDLLASGAPTPPFSFYDRVEQLLYQIVGKALKYYFTSKADLEVYESIGEFIRLRGREPPAYEDLKYNASLVLGNSHPSLGQPHRLPQNYKEIGGYHIDAKIAPLPADLQKLLDDANHGLIYFSMGSNLKSKDMPNELKRDLLKMFGTLKQTVLWKFEEVMPDRPSNVHIVNWAPQPSILAHPNCILFITHGGLLSTTETIHFGKPIIGVPVFADQFMNVHRSVKRGFAKKVDLSYDMAGELKAAIADVLQNPTYANRAKELSFIYHNRPTPPGTELVHWVEHVIKTGGAVHLRSPALDVPFYQKLYLDLLALILAVCFLIRAVIRRIFKKSPQKVKTN